LYTSRINFDFFLDQLYQKHNDTLIVGVD